MRRNTQEREDSRRQRARLEEALRARGARPTRQRRAIYTALAGRVDHPTAEALHRSVRRLVPGLSLATVYTSLETLSAAGLVGRMVGPDGVVRYDARIDVHDHRRCLRCGAIDDLERPSGSTTLETYDTPGFRATDYHIEIVGYCAACLPGSGAPSTAEQLIRASRTTHGGENR
jgi:Fur family transcriptional regulator, peroxide stress response regulator